MNQIKEEERKIRNSEEDFIPNPIACFEEDKMTMTTTFKNSMVLLKLMKMNRKQSISFIAVAP